MELDHVLIAVDDLATAASTIGARYGLSTIDGGRHPGWGTANRIVPLGETYLELVSVVDEVEAVRSAFGRWVAQAVVEPNRPLGWAVRTPALNAVSRRLGLTARAGSREAPDGTIVRWRSAGIEQAIAEPSLPFFIEWETEASPPGRARTSHATGDVEIASLVLDGDVGRVAAWLGDHALPIEVRSGTPRVASVVLSGTAGEIVLGPDPF